MKANQLKWGSSLSYIQMALNILIGLLYTPVMIRLLGDSEYGLYNTVSSTISMLSILSLGIGSGYIRYYAKYKAANDKDSIYRLNALFLVIFSIIGTVAFVCGIFLSNNLRIVFDEGLTAKEYEIARVLMLLLAFNLAISFPASLFSHIITAHERFIFLKLLGMVRTVFSPLITLPLLLMGYRSIAMVTVTVSVYLLVDLIYFLYVVFVLKEKFVFGKVENGLFRSLMIYTSFIAINLIVDQVNSNLCKFLLGRFHGTTVVSVYSVGYTIYTFYMMFSTSVSSVFTPRIHGIVNNDKIPDKRKSLTELFIKVGRIQFIILSLIATGLIFFGKAFIVNYWAGANYGDAYFVVLLLVIPSTIPLIQNLGIEIQRAQNKHKFRSIAYLFMAAINFALTWVLAQRYGAIGATIGTATALLLANGFVMNIYYHKKCNIDIIAFWKSILRMTPALLPPAVIGILALKHINQGSILQFLGAIAVYAVVFAASMWHLGMNDYEKDLVRKPLSKILRKKKV
ncbi:MAG: oligosaccharide flippase family protein [Clostridia bacterium]|nr:oligosaccharide flippase family protein [Clostridia bacterium]